uniref:Phosphotidylinositol phosphatase PTPRQ n=1 Tax=Echinococcus granulosus TaxID=6210 RepID=A0A068X1C8_ECHGR|nr:Phosphotidylinositol phosphatase PTPRQ [Echinococcus granulosus]
MHNPEGVIREFGGFEIVTKNGPPNPLNAWQSVANLTANQRDYQIGGFLPLLTYTVTARGRVSPDIFSVMADPLVFECSPNVKLDAIDSFTVLLTWDSPAPSNDCITGYNIEWLLDNRKQRSIHLPSGHSYTFTDLKPGQTISASISAHCQVSTSVKLEYIGSFSMRKPTFEATYHEDIRDLCIVVHDPEDVVGEFGGFEILTKTGPPDSPNAWKSAAKLTAGAQEYRMEKLLPLLTYSVTVRGHVLPHSFSVMADPLVFEVIHADLSVPQNVKLEAVNPNAVLMTWGAPVSSNGHLTGYTIEWGDDMSRQERTHRPPVHFHVFTQLQHGQTIFASVCTNTQPSASVKFEYIGFFSEIKTVSTQHLQEFTQKPVFAATYHEEIEELDIVVHGPKVANLTAEEREYQLVGLHPSKEYAVTVSGHVTPTPNDFSVLADPLVFRVIQADLSVPQDVQLEAIDHHTVKMTRQPPTEPHGLVTGYTIEWNLDSTKEGDIKLTSSNFHVFEPLQPEQTVFAAVYARIQPKCMVPAVNSSQQQHLP